MVLVVFSIIQLIFLYILACVGYFLTFSMLSNVQAGGWIAVFEIIALTLFTLVSFFCVRSCVRIIFRILEEDLQENCSVNYILGVFFAMPIIVSTFSGIIDISLSSLKLIEMVVEISIFVAISIPYLYLAKKVLQ